MEMEDAGTTCAARGSLYKVLIEYDCIGFGIDLDNAAKAILDALIGVAIDDDRGVVELVIKKNTHRKKEALIVSVSKVGFRPVPAPAAKRPPNKKARTRVAPVRPARTRRVRKKGTAK